MLTRIKSWLAGDGPKSDRPPIPPDRLAAAALLVEAAQLDGHYGSEERARIETLLAERFGLDAEAAKALAEAGSDAQAEAVDLFGFTRRAALGLGEAERAGIVEMLWEVVYADGTEHAYESNLVRRITGLLGVPDRASGEAKRRVLARLGLKVSTE